MSEKKEVGWSMGFFEALTLLFIALKLTHYIDWSWWAVLAPIWIPLLFVLVVLAIYATYLMFSN